MATSQQWGIRTGAWLIWLAGGKLAGLVLPWFRGNTEACTANRRAGATAIGAADSTCGTTPASADRVALHEPVVRGRCARRYKNSVFVRLGLARRYLLGCRRLVDRSVRRLQWPLGRFSDERSRARYCSPAALGHHPGSQQERQTEHGHHDRDTDRQTAPTRCEFR